MKKLLALSIALMLALLTLCPVLAEEGAAQVADAAEEVVEEAQADVEQAADEVQADVEQAAEEVQADVAEAAEEAQEAVEAAAQPEVSPVFKKLLEVPWYTWAVLAALIVAAVLLWLSSRKAKWDSRRLSMGAMCIAIAFVASCIRLFRMPQGGSITPAAMLPLVMFMVACGPLQGFVVGCAYGFLQLITDPYVLHPIQMLVDYPLAYGAMVLACLALAIPVKKQWQLPIAVLLAGIGRYLMAVLSGAIFFAEYAGEQNAWIYSLVYNISYLGPDTLVCMVIACIPGMWQLVDMIKKRS